MSGFALTLAALTAIPALLAARRAWWLLIPFVILFTPQLAAVLLVSAQLGGGLALQAALVALHACFIATVVFSFLVPHRPTRWELLYTVPGQVFFVGGLLFLFGKGFSALLGVGQGAWLLAAVPFGVALVSMAATHQARTIRTPIAVPGLAAPLRVVHLSDIHVGTFMGDGRLQRMAARINALAPDLIVATGDFVTIRSEGDYSPLLRFVRALDRPPLGIYGCLGNHDLPVGRPLVTDLEAAGMRMLVNEAERVALPGGGALTIAGLPFYWRGRAERYPAAFAKLTDGVPGPVLMLCHDPAAFDTFRTDRDVLVLAGHLHGGQIGLNFLGLPVSILRLLNMYDQGMWRRERLQMYVHRGTGLYGFPVRIGVPAEIALLELAPDTSGDRRSQIAD
jgi:predicted MPP superfamily phosphohydrolase